MILDRPEGEREYSFSDKAMRMDTWFPAEEVAFCNPSLAAPVRALKLHTQEEVSFFSGNVYAFVGKDK